MPKSTLYENEETAIEGSNWSGNQGVSDESTPERKLDTKKKKREEGRRKYGNCHNLSKDTKDQPGVRDQDRHLSPRGNSYLKRMVEYNQS